MKRILFFILSTLLMAMPANAVLKEKDLSQTLQILRSELEKYHQEQEKQSAMFQQQSELVRKNLFTIMQRSNQNALMLYSQKRDYVFDLTYACHEATEQYTDFKKKTLPFRTFIKKMEYEIARYDSLIASLRTMPVMTLDEKAMTDRNVCLTLATNIRNSLAENQEQTGDYIKYYDMTEHRLKTLNDYANVRYGEIQSNIFRNGGDNYFDILAKLRQSLSRTAETVSEKYQPPSRNIRSQWDSRMILGLFFIIIFYGIVATALNQVVIRFLLPRRLRTDEFMKKRACIMMATTTVTFAIVLGIVRTLSNQNFIIMASNLLVEYAWLLGVILISLLLRVSGSQIKSAFRIYTPLIVVGFIVISFRIILIPNELVNLIFPPMLLVCALWQWNVIGRHNENIPRSDVNYTYVSLFIFIGSVICSWAGYTLLSVQILIWWIMQLTCILTITCFSGWMRQYAQRHHIAEKPVTKRWLFDAVYKVVLPSMGLFSILLSIYWAADVFNLSDLTWRIFTTNFIDTQYLKISLFSIIQVIVLYLLFSYINKLSKELLRLHFSQGGSTDSDSRKMMGNNVVNVLVWGLWLLISLGLLGVSYTWLAIISGGLSTGVGFAMKDILENIYYGISLMTGRIKVGDWVELDGTMGKVTSISYTSTMIESLYGEVIAYQNSQLFTKNYKNLTKNHGYVLAVVPFGVAYGSNLHDVSRLVEDAVNDMRHEWMDPEKRVKAVVSEMGDSSINFKLFVWADAVKKSYVISDVMKCIYDTLNTHHVEIPFPQRDIHIINE